MDEFIKLPTNSLNPAKIPDRNFPHRGSIGSQLTTSISNRNYSIKTHRKKRKRPDSLIKVTCLDCQAVSTYQIGDYVQCQACNSNRFTL